MLELKSVSKAFGMIVVASDIDLSLARGEALGIIGPNGAGKSTLFNLITGMLRPDRGRILLEGRDITGLPPEQRCRAGLGRSFQIPLPFEHLSVFENLSVAALFGGGMSQAEAVQVCGETLALTGLEAKANLRAGSLSLLDRKRLELARALATRPRILVTRRNRGRPDGCGVPHPDRDHTLHPRARHQHHLDRACGSRITRSCKPPCRAGFRAHRRAGPAVRGHALERGANDLYGRSGMTALLNVTALDAFYGDFQALFGIDLELHPGEAVAVIGANGSGKSTLLKSLAGLVKNRPGAIRLAGQNIGDHAAAKIVRMGLALVPEGRQLFPSLSVEENLLIGAYGGDRKSPWDLDAIYRMFPVLRERRKSSVTVLSGGQQQMIAIGRALMSNPSILLCDEISLGLAPIIVENIYQMIPRIRENGTGVIVVEQDIARALRSADRFYCLQEGHVTLSGRPSDVDQAAIRAAYFGA